jgi:DNA-binding SARP family transcriptional activator/Tfp pilus assembly protein PilF
MIRFGILGPIAVWVGEQLVRVGGPRERRLLAMLLLHSNKAVPLHRLAAALWAQDAPATAKAQLHNSVSRLRRALSVADSETVAIESWRQGFRLQIGEDQLDSLLFARYVAEAGREAEPVRTAQSLRAALGLWRGPALDGIDDGILGTEARRLDDQRLACLEQRITIDLDLGRPAEVAGELAALAAEHPERERLIELRMLALYRAGRRQDALDVYAKARSRLVERAGLDPRRQLDQLQQAILRSDPALDPPRPAVAGSDAPAPVDTPAQLPADGAHFTGRVAQLRQLDLLVEEADTMVAPSAVVITAIDGTAGVGKTALATHWAHRVRDRFPDGQLYVNLRGYSTTAPLAPIQALAQFLRALRVPTDQVPGDPDEAASLYRTRLADKRMLVVLDNALNPDQVRPLLPAAAGSFVVITSRDRLSGLVARDGARRINLDILDPDETHHLLTRILGADRTGAEPDACAELGRLCAHLPLALRIAAAHLLDNPDQPIESYVAALRQGDRLDALAVDGDERSAVRVAFDLSYVALPAPARRLFRLLGLVPGRDVTIPAAAALAQTTTGEAAALLERLVRAHMLDRSAPERYSFHDLMRRYAFDLAGEDETATAQRRARSRLFDHYLQSADRAARAFYPDRLRLPIPPAASGVPVTDFNDAGAASAWLDAEEPNLVAAVVQASEGGSQPVAWLLADTLRCYFSLRRSLANWQVAVQAALAAATAAGDLYGQAAAQLSVAELENWRERQGQAIDRYDQALNLMRRCGWWQGETAALNNLALVYCDLGRPQAAVDHYRQALTVNQRTGRLGGQCSNHAGLGIAYGQMGQTALAIEHFAQAVELARKLKSRSSEAIDLVNLAESLHAAGRSDQALDNLDRGIRLYREAGYGSEAYALQLRAAIECDLGRYDEAIEHARAAGDLARRTGRGKVEAEALGAQATIHHRLGQHEQALELVEHALRLIRDSDRYSVAQLLIGLAVARLHLGQHEPARDQAEQALTFARQHSYRMLEGIALTVLAQCRLELDDRDGAARVAAEAVAVQRETGYRLGEARALVPLGWASANPGPHWTSALALFADLGTPEAEQVRSLLASVDNRQSETG